MTDSKVTATLRRALALARRTPEGALDVLEEGLHEARSKADPRDVSMLAKHAAVLCTALGDLPRALRYYGEAVAGDPGDAYLQFALGQLQWNLGQKARARVALNRCIALANDYQDAELVGMAESVLRQGSSGKKA